MYNILKNSTTSMTACKAKTNPQTQCSWSCRRLMSFCALRLCSQFWHYTLLGFQILFMRDVSALVGFSNVPKLILIIKYMVIWWQIYTPATQTIRYVLMLQLGNPVEMWHGPFYTDMVGQKTAKHRPWLKAPWDNCICYINKIEFNWIELKM